MGYGNSTYGFVPSTNVSPLLNKPSQQQQQQQQHIRLCSFTSSQTPNLRHHYATKSNSIRRSYVKRPCSSPTTPITALATPKDVTDETFDTEVLQSDVPVVVDFYAAWCGPCKLMTPLMDWAAAEYDGRVKVVKIDTELCNSFVKRFDIYGLPTFAVFVDGQPRGLQEGAMSKNVFKDYIEKHAFC